jgi:hypothetical protein
MAVSLGGSAVGLGALTINATSVDGRPLRGGAGDPVAPTINTKKRQGWALGGC